MIYSINQKVRLSGARGGWDGYISDVVSGPGGEPYYRVHSDQIGDLHGEALVAESEIAAGPLSAPSFSSGDDVALYSRLGTVVTDNGDDTYTVSVEWTPNPHLTLTRTHTVPLWRLAIENP